MRKADIQQRYEDGRYRPAVNVKVDWPTRSRMDELAAEVADEMGCPGFTMDWLEERCGEDQVIPYGVLEDICGDGFEQASDLAHETFSHDQASWLSLVSMSDTSVKVYSAGRSGGWLYVLGIGDVDDWDAIACNRWGRFERACHAIVADIPRACLWSLCANVYEQEMGWLTSEAEKVAEGLKMATAHG